MAEVIRSGSEAMKGARHPTLDSGKGIAPASCPVEPPPECKGRGWKRVTDHLQKDS